MRKNDWWPEAIVARWRERAAQSLVHGDPRMPGLSENARRTVEAMRALGDDPFRGSRERRIMPEGMSPSDLELGAARDALARANVAPEDVDLFLVHTQLTDHLSVPNGPTLHQRLGLRPECLTFTVDSAQNSFAVQLELCRALIGTGRAKRALLVQSSQFGQVVNPEDENSAWFGDGATAQVVGEVAPGRGVLGISHRTDGRYPLALTVGKPGRAWHRGAELYLHTADAQQARGLFFCIAELAERAVTEALDQAAVRKQQVGFYASHQATHWMRAVTQAATGLEHARTVDFFPATASLSACNVPFALACGEREGLLRPGDYVAAFSGGCGVTVSGLVLGWGK